MFLDEGNYGFMSCTQPIFLLSQYVDQAIGPSDQSI